MFAFVNIKLNLNHLLILKPIKRSAETIVNNCSLRFIVLFWLGGDSITTSKKRKAGCFTSEIVANFLSILRYKTNNTGIALQTTTKMKTD